MNMKLQNWCFCSFHLTNLTRKHFSGSMFDVAGVDNLTYKSDHPTSDYCHLPGFWMLTTCNHPATVSNGYYCLNKSFTGSLGLIHLKQWHRLENCVHFNVERCDVTTSGLTVHNFYQEFPMRRLPGYPDNPDKGKKFSIAMFINS